MTRRSTLTRLLALPLCLLVLAAILPGRAAAVSQTAGQLRPDLTILIDGQKQTFYNVAGQEVPPLLSDGTTYLPLRAIGELMGKDVDWNQDTKTVTLTGPRTAPATTPAAGQAPTRQDVTAQVRDDFTIVVDGTVRAFANANGQTVYPLLYQGTTYLPLRAIGGLMGKTVEWDGATQTVTLTSTLVTDADSFSGGTPGTASGTTPSTDGQLITGEAAAAAALSHAGLTAQQVTFSHNRLEWENGRQIYDIEFYTADRREYDYEIDALTGQVLSYDHEGGKTGTAQSSGQIVTLDRAKEIALAKVPGATATHIRKAKLDWEDGQQVYEVEIVYNGMEYELEIDAATGTVRSFESESEHD